MDDGLAEKMLYEMGRETLGDVNSCVLYLKHNLMAVIQFIQGQPRYSDLSSLPSLSAIHPQQRATVMEIHGPSSSGKTHTIYLSIIKCLLSYSTKISTAVVLFDMDNTFDIGRFLSLAQFFIESSGDLLGTGNVTNDLSTILDECLQRLVVFRPRTTAQLATDLIGLPAYMQLPSMAHLTLSLVVVDPLNGLNYWVDRRFLEDRRAEGDRAAEHPSRSVLRVLQCLQVEHAVAVIITTWKLSSVAQQGQFQWDQTQTQSGPGMHPGTYAYTRPRLGVSENDRATHMVLSPIPVEVLDSHQSLAELLLLRRPTTHGSDSILHTTTIRPIITSVSDVSAFADPVIIEISNIGATVSGAVC